MSYVHNSLDLFNCHRIFCYGLFQFMDSNGTVFLSWVFLVWFFYVLTPKKFSPADINHTKKNYVKRVENNDQNNHNFLLVVMKFYSNVRIISAFLFKKLQPSNYEPLNKLFGHKLLWTKNFFCHHFSVVILSFCQKFLVEIIFAFFHFPSPFVKLQNENVQKLFTRHWNLFIFSEWHVLRQFITWKTIWKYFREINFRKSYGGELEKS